MNKHYVKVLTEFTFTIHGRGLGKEKINPMGYVRTTVKSINLEYAEWVGYVRNCFLKKYPEFNNLNMKKILHGKEDKDIRWVLMTRIWYANDIRPDPGNVTKSITDALFDSDKHVLEQSISYDFDKEMPRVFVILFKIKDYDQN